MPYSITLYHLQYVFSKTLLTPSELVSNLIPLELMLLCGVFSCCPVVCCSQHMRFIVHTPTQCSHNFLFSWFCANTCYPSYTQSLETCNVLETQTQQHYALSTTCLRDAQSKQVSLLPTRMALILTRIFNFNVTVAGCYLYSSNMVPVWLYISLTINIESQDWIMENK